MVHLGSKTAQLGLERTTRLCIKGLSAAMLGQQREMFCENIMIVKFASGIE